MRTIRSFSSPDGKRRLDICRRDDGRFSFTEEREWILDMSATGLPDETYWSVLRQGGLFDSAEAAEREARARTPWMTSASR